MHTAFSFCDYRVLVCYFRFCFCIAVHLHNEVEIEILSFLKSMIDTFRNNGFPFVPMGCKGITEKNMCTVVLTYPIFFYSATQENCLTTPVVQL